MVGSVGVDSTGGQVSGCGHYWWMSQWVWSLLVGESVGVVITGGLVSGCGHYWRTSKWVWLLVGGSGATDDKRMRGV